MNSSIKNINSATFSQYGYIIRYDEGRNENFQVVLRENDAAGWRIAVSKITISHVCKLARHPNSMESVAPVNGVALLCVAPPETPECHEVFLLDKPVCLYKNVWHCAFTLSEFSLVKVCENVTVHSEEYNLKSSEIRIAVLNKPLG